MSPITNPNQDFNHVQFDEPRRLLDSQKCGWGLLTGVWMGDEGVLSVCYE